MIERENGHCDVNDALLLALQGIDRCVHGAFDNEARHVGLFLLADSEDSAERLLLNLYRPH